MRDRFLAVVSLASLLGACTVGTYRPAPGSRGPAGPRHAAAPAPAPTHHARPGAPVAAPAAPPAGAGAPAAGGAPAAPAASTPAVVAAASHEVGAPPRVPRGGPRKSATEVLPPAKQQIPLKLSPAHVKAVNESAKRYADAEAKATPAEKAKLAALRAQLAKEKKDIPVGITSVFGADLHKITGALVPKVSPKEVEENRARRLADPNRANLLSHSMLHRLAPPPNLLRKNDPRAEPGDVQRAAPAAVGVSNDAGWSPANACTSTSASACSWHDWMPPVRQQGACGSCWAFAATAVHEFAQLKMNVQQLDLSEQHLLNCATLFPGASTNCDGNSPVAAFAVMSTAGQAQEKTIPYVQHPVGCVAAAPSQYRIAHSGFAATQVDLPAVAEIKAALVAHGPVTTRLVATDAFQNFTGGTTFREFGVVDDLKHGHIVTIVGWDDSRQAWHVRNSWGAWADAGYAWIAYGTNKIGSFALWADAAPLAPPPTPQFTDRYLSVKNDSGEPLKVSVLLQSDEGGTWKWLPANPGPSAAPWQFAVPAGATFDVVRPDTKKPARGRAARVWATSLDGKRQWSTFRDKDAVLASKAYAGATRERLTLPFAKPDAPAITADQLYSAGRQAREQKNYSLARYHYQFLTWLFPTEPRAHEARFWIGWTEYMESKYLDALQAFYDMNVAAPQKHVYSAYSTYFMGLSYAALGYCGYADHAFTIVAYGEIGAPPDFVKAAIDEIAYLQADNGQVCTNWQTN